MTVAPPPVPALSIRGLTKRFSGRPAVDHLDLDVPAGSFCGLLGPNGSGKTTTLRIVSGMERPDAGTATVDGLDTWADPVAVRRRIGVVPDPLRLFDRLTAREHLRHLGRLRGLAPDEVERRSAELLGVLGLEADADAHVGGFSHGMRKKVALAAALLHRPGVLLLDEPFEGVDPGSTVTIHSILERYRAGGGTVVFSSHVMALVERYCDVVAIIASGRLLAAGPVDQVRAGASLEQRFIDLVGGGGVDATELQWLDGGGPGPAA